MSARREHHKRELQDKIGYRKQYRRWMKERPAMWRITKYIRWVKSNPVK